LKSTTTITIAPRLEPRARRQWQRLSATLSRELATHADVPRAIAQFRATLQPLGDCPTTETLKVLLAVHVVMDLVAQGWTLTVDASAIQLTQDNSPTTSDDAKAAVRRRHLVERDAQLREQSVTAFIKSMEQRRLTKNGWHSIYSLMRDGRPLAAQLTTAAAITNDDERLAALASTINPYLQFVGAGMRCEHTGLLLTDIWRYFRHTWTTAYRTVPGRSMMILLRDAAAPNHPVIGIAALGSAVVQQTVRDTWIGWDAQHGVDALLATPTRRNAERLEHDVQNRIKDVYVKDLISDGIITRKDLNRPTTDTIAHLRQAGEDAIQRHRQHPQKGLHKSLSPNGPLPDKAWEERARSHLFRAKRCRLLATLLGIRQVFAQHLKDYHKEALTAAFENHALRASVAQLLRLTKAERVGICMMDITVCGAIAPYNHLLGGKLVSALLCSPEVTKYYADRYGRQQSLIASSMRGKGVVRRPSLVLLGTTSQYTRIKIPTSMIGGDEHGIIEYKPLGYSIGYGSFHFSNDTVSIIDTLLARTNGGRKVNSIFGEGVNPLMRKIREGLDAIDLPSDQLLQHGNQRIVYGVSLAHNFRNVLLGLQRRPKYVLPQANPATITAKIAAYWQRRWLDARIDQPGLLDAVALHTLDLPVRHGAQVPLPDDEPGLFMTRDG
jgi:hypothetical protein